VAADRRVRLARIMGITHAVLGSASRECSRLEAGLMLVELASWYPIRACTLAASLLPGLADRTARITIRGSWPA
jgi:hypothetical protein